MSGANIAVLAAMEGIPPLVFDIDQAARVGNCSAFCPSSCQADSNVATTTTSGGTPPYTYAWTFVSGDNFTINSPTSSSTLWTKTNSVCGSPSFNGTYRCTVTDDNSVEASDTVSVSLNFNDLT